MRENELKNNMQTWFVLYIAYEFVWKKDFSTRPLHAERRASSINHFVFELSREIESFVVPWKI